MILQPVSQAPDFDPTFNLKEKLRILILSDLHLPKPASFKILANRSYISSMNYAVLLGDIVKSYGTNQEYAHVNYFISHLNIPYGVITGNHEWFFAPFYDTMTAHGESIRQSSASQQLLQLKKFLSFFRMRKLWHSFDSGHGRFIFLSLNKPKDLNQDTKCEKILGEPERLCDEQLTFLEDAISTGKDYPIFIFCHAPLMIKNSLDIIYYDSFRSGCIELPQTLNQLLAERPLPTFWVSGHLHIHPAHYLSKPYKLVGNIWQVHCPDSWGYGRWSREHSTPQKYSDVFSKHLEIDSSGVKVVVHDHQAQKDTLIDHVSFTA